MTVAKRQAASRETLNLRVKPEVRGLIDRAAKARGTTRTDFILGAAKQAAEDALIDRVLIAVSGSAYAEFLKRLDAPAKPNARLRRAMKTSPPWKTT